MSTPTDGGSPGPISEVAQRRDRMQSTLDELHRVVDLPDTGDAAWRTAAEKALAGAAATWDRHVTGTEAPGGILAEVVEREPRLAHQVEVLRTQHGEVRALLDRVRSVLTGQDTPAARREVQALTMRLSHHHHLGAELIHSAYEVDLGGDG